MTHLSSQTHPVLPQQCRGQALSTAPPTVQKRRVDAWTEGTVRPPTTRKSSTKTSQLRYCLDIKIPEFEIWTRLYRRSSTRDRIESAGVQEARTAEAILAATDRDTSATLRGGRKTKSILAVVTVIPREHVIDESVEGLVDQHSPGHVRHRFQLVIDENMKDINLSPKHDVGLLFTAFELWQQTQFSDLFQLNADDDVTLDRRHNPGTRRAKDVGGCGSDIANT